nr:retrotransposon protein, putative, Ty1-copia subclass [Tanacetum cinerariifolium]
MNKGALDLYVGNGKHAAVEAIGSFDLTIPSRRVLVLDNCHFAPSITRVDMHNHISNKRSIYTCSNKKSKHNLDSTFLWHCHIGHINKKCIAKLQHDRLLELIDDESFDVCISCISRKMARKPFTHASERADDLLGLIHSDGYALESAAPILNMVPTKKVNKILYKMWHEKVLNLSYLKSNLISHEASRSIVDFDEIQRQDEQPLDNASEHQPEDEYDDVDPQTDVRRHPSLESESIEIDQGDLSKAQGLSTPVEVMRMKGTTYASTVGYIMYAVRCTRPDVAFSQNLTSRYQQNPSESHWTFVKNILKYLRNTKDMLFVYGGDSKTELSVTCYTDASWETNRDDFRSHTRYVFVMNEGAVEWKISKQSTAAISYMETEYIVAFEAAMEAIWIHKFIYGLGIISNNDRPMDMYCDNTSAITIANEPGVQRVPNIFDENITLFEK